MVTVMTILVRQYHSDKTSKTKDSASYIIHTLIINLYLVLFIHGLIFLRILFIQNEKLMIILPSYTLNYQHNSPSEDILRSSAKQKR